MREFGREDADFPFGGNMFGFRGAIATEHYLSAQAGMDVLKQGGNAFDAAAAAALVEGVVNPHMYTLGGECPMLLCVQKEARVVSVNGNTVAPARATLEAYKRLGFELIPPEGVFAAGAPAAFSALIEMLLHYGSLPFEEIAEPAYLLAKEGFPVHEGLVRMPSFSIQSNREKFLDLWPASARLYLNADKSVPAPGQKIKNTALADVIGSLIEESRKHLVKSRESSLKAALDMFYQGDIAREICSFVTGQGGFLARQDLARFRTYLENPVSVEFGDTTIFKCGPWSQGPVFLQLLKLLEGFDLSGLKHNSADYLHLWIEAAKLAYADREQYYADPQFVDVPMDRLLSADYNDKRRALIDLRRASGLHRPGDPRRLKASLPEEEMFLWESWGYGTVHVAVIDAQGNMAALTPSGGWISGNEVIPSLGFPLTTRLQTFYLDARHVNAPAAGKRPRTTLSPSLAFHRGRPWMVFGTMGGDQQDQWCSQFFLNRVLFGMSVQEAIEAPKVTFDHSPAIFHPHNAFPRRVRLEGRILAAVAEQLAARGHQVEVAGDWTAGFICAAAQSEDGTLEAGADPRGNKASVFPACALVW
ncbi:MAG: gamma-glutamyltransferase family protein [Desulforhabdus sp.]|jgi:gamma-glutamyltranspeptidase/glutathione hydrolase|nr:gamma-glutamyltransferase family protein [Desulforhabdus sp.]